MVRFLFILLTLLNSAAFGQHYFNKTIDITGLGYGEVYRGLTIDDYAETAYLLGTTSTLDQNNPILVQINLTTGDLIDTVFVANSSTGKLFTPGNNNTMKCTDDESIIFCGQMQFDDEPENNPNGIIFKTNLFGDTLWSHEFVNSSAYSGFSSVGLTNDGNYIVSGYTTDFGSFAQAWLVKMDPDGNLLWQQNYGGFGGENAYSVDTTLDGGYILAGFTDSYGAGERDIYVIKTDEFGNVIWEKWFGGVGSEGGAAKQLSNGNFMVFGGWRFKHPELPWLATSHGYAVVLDNTGNIVWENIYTLSDTSKIEHYYQFDGMNDFQEVNDGYVFVGLYTDTIINNPAGWVFKTDFSGNMLWSRTYKIRTNDHYLWDMTELPGGDLLFGGFVFPTGGGVDSQDGWIMRTNCLGFNGPPILGASLVLEPETYTATVYNASQRFGDGSINWGDGDITYFTEHDTTVFTHAYTQNGDYDITFKINACYHHDSLIFHQTISGIPDPEPPIADFKLFPNPTSGSLTVSYNPTGESLDAGIQIYDMAGRLVFNKNLPLFYVSTILELDHLSTGTYLLRFFTVEGIEIVEKLVVY